MNDETMPDEIKAFIPDDNNYVKWSNNIGMWDAREQVNGTSYTKTSLINEKQNEAARKAKIEMLYEILSIFDETSSNATKREKIDNLKSQIGEDK